MKRIISILLAVTLLFSFTACNTDSANSSAVNSTSDITNSTDSTVSEESS